MTEQENYIQLKKHDIFKVEIRDDQGKPTGEYLTFDLEDIDLPLKINECEARHNRNVEYLKSTYAIIEKKEDKKGKYLLSWREEEKIKALKDFYTKEIEALDLFLGEGGTKKLLNGRKPYYSMYADFGEILKPIMPKLENKADTIKKNIIEKYKMQQSDVLK